MIVFEDEAKMMRKRNIKALADILDGMQEIVYRTTWAEAQRLLIENPSFETDKCLQSKTGNKCTVLFSV